MADNTGNLYPLSRRRLGDKLILIDHTAGFALPAILVLAVFIVPLIATLHQGLRNQSSNNIALKKRLQFNSELENSIIKHYNNLTSGMLNQTEIQLAEHKAILTRKLISSFRSNLIELNASLNLPQGSFQVSHFFAQRADPQMEPQVPNWSILSGQGEDICLKWHSNPKKTAEPSLSSSLTCVSTQQVDRSVFIPGNLRLATELRIEPNKFETLRIVILGILEHQAVLQLPSLAKQRIEIISAGNISISQISSPNFTEGELIISSSTGSVIIGKLPQNATLCGTDNPQTKLRIQVESTEKITLGENNWSNINKIGCPMTKDPIIWAEQIFLSSTIR